MFGAYNIMYICCGRCHVSYIYVIPTMPCVNTHTDTSFEKTTAWKWELKWAGFLASIRDPKEGLGRPKKTKYWQITSRHMVKENGKTFPNKQVDGHIGLCIPLVNYQHLYIYIYIYIYCSVSGLKRCGKACRLRWMNYLRPDIKRDNITPDEQDLIIRLHKLLGNRYLVLQFQS